MVRACLYCIFPSFYLRNNRVCFIFHAYSMATPGKLDPSFECVRVKVSYLTSTLYIRLEWFLNYRGSSRQRYCSCLTNQTSQNISFHSLFCCVFQAQQFFKLWDKQNLKRQHFNPSLYKVLPPPQHNKLNTNYVSVRITMLSSVLYRVFPLIKII